MGVSRKGIDSGCVRGPSLLTGCTLIPIEPEATDHTRRKNQNDACGHELSLYVVPSSVAKQGAHS